MKRRTFIASTLASVAMPRLALSPTPIASPETRPQDDPVDSTARNLTDAMLDIRPLHLLEALETAKVTDENLRQAGDSQPVTSRPWADYGDTDLYNSLGGVALTLDDRSLHDAEGEFLGGYIVYESAEIAYAELVRKIGPMMESPTLTTVTRGVNVWILESNDTQIGVTRIGYVIVIALMQETNDVVTGMIDHLQDVVDHI